MAPHFSLEVMDKAHINKGKLDSKSAGERLLSFEDATGANAHPVYLQWGGGEAVEHSFVLQTRATCPRDTAKPTLLR